MPDATHGGEDGTRWVRVLELADHLCHKMFDPYINANPLGHHMPGWGLVQLWQWHLCMAYERAADCPILAGSADPSEREQ